MEPILFVSGDGHIGALPETYRSYIETRYRDSIAALEEENKRFTQVAKLIEPEISADMIEAVDGENAMRSGGYDGAWDVKRRMKELDREGVAAEIVFPGHQFAVAPFFAAVNNPWPADLRAAGRRAYHRWLADCFAESGGRIFGVADPGPCIDMAESVRELRWCAEHGFRSAMPPGTLADNALPPITDPYYEPFWTTCAELGLVLGVHAGYGHAQGAFWDFVESFQKNVVGATNKNKVGSQPKAEGLMQAFDGAEDSPFKLDMGPRRFLWQMMVSGVFDRHPTLKLALTEVRADWLPATLKRLDELAVRQRTPLKMKPSEYWTRHCFITPSSIHISEMEMRDEIGVDRLMFGTDYPHPEGTWPNTKDWIRMTFKNTSEVEARKILGENAIRCYGLDRAKLEPIARRIGFKPGEVLVASANVHPHCVASFEQRAGILRPAEQIRSEDIDPLFEEDVRRVASGGRR